MWGQPPSAVRRAQLDAWLKGFEILFGEQFRQMRQPSLPSRYGCSENILPVKGSTVIWRVLFVLSTLAEMSHSLDK
jgi:hypothetical protein